MNDMTRVVMLKGAVEKVEWVNPHVEVWLVTTPAGEPNAAPQTWVIGLTSPGVLARLGWTRHTLNAGDKVTMEINPLRSGEHGGVFRSVTLANGQVVTGRALDYEKGVTEHQDR